ncbi:DUF4132 domain-containing protein [Saccharothrix xinjiangensis]|uniref:DUF4132 domain-containing protein n=1 Tax=Saccharothrix xinjiangensis TaxID=204798 RepID=A0ABV9YD69_9PSEU
MRRWELVEGGSAKFWEVSRDGSVVTVRFGRLGSSGQQKATELSSEDAATAHVAKLVAQKEKKGYRAVAGSATGSTTAPGPATSGPATSGPATSSPATSSLTTTSSPTTTSGVSLSPGATTGPGVGELPDESVFALPRKWWRHVHPRRDGHVRREAEPDRGAVESVRAALGSFPPKSARALDNPAGDAGLAEAARSYLAGEATPLGAGAVAQLIAAEGIPQSQVLAELADAWAVEHGLAFAARAALEASRVQVHWRSSGLQETPRALRFAQPRQGRRWDHSHGVVAARVRELVADADDAGDAAVQSVVDGYLDDPVARFTAAYLAPHRHDLVERVCAEVEASGAVDDWISLVCALNSAGQLRSALASDPVRWRLMSPDVLHTVLDGIGPAVAPVLAPLLDEDLGADFRKALLDVFAELPTDEAFGLLVSRLDGKGVQAAVLEMSRRYPVRALRLLAGAPGDTARLLFRGHLQRHPDLPDRIGLSDAERAAVERVREEDGRLVEASAEGLPELLLNPPWAGGRTTVRPVVVEGLTAPDLRAVEWAEGERESWLAEGRARYHRFRSGDWARTAEEFLGGRLPWFGRMALMFNGPEAVVRPLLARWEPGTPWESEGVARAIAARFGVDALDKLAPIVAAGYSASAAELVQPLVSREVAEVVADWLARLKSARPAAVAWVRRHPAAAARLLLPAAVGPVGPARHAAESVLRLVPDEAREAAREQGPEAERAVGQLLSADPLTVLPAKIPVPGPWADPAVLPQVIARKTGLALPRDSVRHLLTVLALSKPDAPYAGVAVVEEVCEPASLARFGRELFRLWTAVGAPAKDSWALTAQGVLGDDDTVRLLVPLIRAWPGESQHARAVAGLDVLAAIGTDLALVSLNGIARKAKFKALKQRAQEKVAAVAEQLGLTAEQLADRLVPDFGLDDAATLVVDYGPRRFTVGFDEQLKPYVLDEDGKRRKDLPKPGAKDDEKAVDEHKRFAALKKDVRTVAADQVERLELAMVLGRRWSAAEFRTLLAGHPLLWHVVRRLVWVTDGGASFRVAEDRTFADASDDAFELPDDARVGVAHPLRLGDDLAAWSEVFADYEILQPFPQLGRAVHALDERERRARRLERFEGSVVPVGRLLGLTKRGWERGQPQDAGVECWILRPLAGGAAIVVNLEPGIVVGVPHEFPEQKLTEIWVDGSGRGDWHARGDRAFGELDAVTASEVLAEFTALTS